MFDSELRKLADAGSAEHQWKLSQAYREAGRVARASRYFRRAIEQGYPAAITYQIEQWTAAAGEFGNFSAAHKLLDKYPDLHELDSWRWRLGVISGLFDKARDMESAREQYRAGNPEALRYVALRCSFAGMDEQAIALLSRAAVAGDSWSQRILDPNAIADLPVLAAGGESPVALSDRDWQSAFTDPGAVKEEDLATEPRVYLCKGWLPLLGCRLLATAAQPELKPSLVYDAQSGRQIESTFRTSHSMTFMPWLIDPSIAYIQRRLAQHCGMSPAQCEVLGLLRYEPGQAYKLHYDAFDPNQPGVGDMLRDGGQRIRTALVYLNSGFDGGETRMENLDLEVKGESGDLLVFDNVDAQGQRHPDSLHAGKPVVSGSKWLLSQWYREGGTHFTQQMSW